jgi:hypothetical protein
MFSSKMIRQSSILTLSTVNVIAGFIYSQLFDTRIPIEAAARRHRRSIRWGCRGRGSKINHGESAPKSQICYGTDSILYHLTAEFRR